MRIARSLAAGLLFVVLAGCDGGGSPEPRPLPTPSSTPTATPTSSPSPSPDPSIESARNFLDEFVEIVNLASKSGDTEALAAISSDACKTCRSIISTISEIYGQGGRIESDGWSIVAVRRASEGPNRTAAFEIQVNLAEEVVVKSADAAPEVHEATTRGMRVTVHWSGTGWIAQGLVITE